MRRIVVQAAAALRALRAPGRTFGLEHHRSVGLRQHVRHFTDGIAIEQALDFLEGAHETAVVAHLVDQAFSVGQPCHFFAFGIVEHEGLLAKHVQVLFQRRLDHLAVHAGRGGNDDGVQFDFGQHGVEIGIGAHPGVLVEYIEHITGSIAHGGHRHAGMGVDHRLVGQAHLAQAYYCKANHKSILIEN